MTTNREIPLRNERTTLTITVYIDSGITGLELRTGHTHNAVFPVYPDDLLQIMESIVDVISGVSDADIWEIVDDLNKDS